MSEEQARHIQIFLEHARKSLGELSPETVCERTGARYENGCYRLSVLGSEATVAQGVVSWRCPLQPVFEVITLHYLIYADGSKPKGELISLYDAAPTASTRAEQMMRANIPPLVACFATDMGAFAAATETLGGRMTGRDTAQLLIYPHLPIRITIMPEDEEFPADAQILFDRTLRAQLPAESMVYIADFAVQTLAVAAGKAYPFGRI